MTRRRKNWLGSLLLCCFCLPILASADLGHATDAPGDGLHDVTVLIVRHSEKPHHGRGLSPEGERRARAYADYFDPLQQCGLNLRPQRLIAASNSLVSKRSLLTLQPLSQKLGLPIEHDFAKGQVSDLVGYLRKQNTAPVVLIAWHHGHLNKLIEAFGARSEELLAPWPADAYNRLLVLRFDEQGRLVEPRSQVIKEHVLPSDDDVMHAP